MTDLPNNLLLESVTVPTQFAGVHDTWTDASNNLRTQTGIDRRITPVNQLSAYREPGRVNVNTVTSPQVWDAVVAGPFPVEDLDNDGHLDSNEDINNNQRLDNGEDDDDDKRLDVPEDIPPDYKTDSPSEDGQDNRTVRAFDSSASPTKTVKDVLRICWILQIVQQCLTRKRRIDKWLMLILTRSTKSIRQAALLTPPRFVQTSLQYG